MPHGSLADIMISALHAPPPPRKQALFHSRNKLVIFPRDDWLPLALSQSAGSIKSGFIIHSSPRCRRTSEALLTSPQRAVLNPPNWTRTKSGCFVFESLYVNPSLMQLSAVIARLFQMHIGVPSAYWLVGNLALHVARRAVIFTILMLVHTFWEVFRNFVLF